LTHTGTGEVKGHALQGQRWAEDTGNKG